ncbi:MAG: pyruvate kinase [Anaerolineae bacterium]|nr:pyruvate kinase [Anaerolineae bacterium]
MIRTKIVCTLGPASREPEMLEKLIRAGMTVARLNLSHGSHSYHAETIAHVREVSARIGIPVALLIDLQGPKIRVGDMSENGLVIQPGEHITLTTRPGTAQRTEGGESCALVPVQYRELPAAVRPGERILLDDGLLELEVVRVVNSTDVLCLVVLGGLLKSNKGLNLPGTQLSVPAISEKDWEDLEFGLQQNCDWIAMSFVRQAAEVSALKDYITRHTPAGVRPALVIAKIEKPQALENMAEIVAVADGIMVARGDLGIEIPAEKVPLAQKRLIQTANIAGKPVITATQMLDSMIRNPRPTRAEASDVANAILDGTDAIMLSGETAAGDYPLESVETMVRIAAEVEKAMAEPPWSPPHHVGHAVHDVTDAVSHSTCEVAYRLDAKAIISSTASGLTARAVARYRPQTLIVAATTSEIVMRQLLLTWGVRPLLTPVRETTEEVLQQAVTEAARAGYVGHGDRVVITAGIAPNMAGMTNLMLVELVELAERIDFHRSSVTGESGYHSL